MIKIYFIFTLVLVFAASAIAQTSKTTTKRSKQQKTEMIEMSDLSSDDVCGVDQPYKPLKPYVGKIIKRKFKDDQITLEGIILREDNDERHFINIDTEHLSGKLPYFSRELSSILTLNRRVKIWVNMCGEQMTFLFIRKVQAF